MFGYVTANLAALSDEAKARYQASYCGLCHALGRLHGSLSRLTLTYDLTFLAIFHSLLYEENQQLKKGHCPPHPLKAHEYICTPSVDYAADMNIALSYYNLLDDWQDDKNYGARLEAAVLKKSFLQVQAKYPRQCEAIEQSLKALSAMERDNVLNPDLPAACFGQLMAEIFVRNEDQYANDLRRFGFALGKFIYLLDAMVDLKKDIQKEKYNPVITLPTDSFREILCLLMSDCTAAFGKFENLQNDELLNNILYSGVWLKFEMQQAKENKKKEKHK